MKKLLTVIALVVLSLSVVSSAHAYIVLDNWQINLSAWSLGTFSNIDRLNPDGSSAITQQLGADGVLSVGDAFTEDSGLIYDSYWVEPGFNPITDKKDFGLLAQGYRFYSLATGLAGQISNMNADSFDYTFTPDAGSVEFQLLTPSGVVSLATLEVVAPSGGTNDLSTQGGVGPNGDTDLTLRFVSALNGVFLTSGGIDISLRPQDYVALLNTNNLLRIVGGQTGANGYVVAAAQNSGQANIAVVPEPTSMLLLGMGLAGLAAIRRKKAA